MASKIPTRAPHGQIHSGALAKNRLTHVLSSSFLDFGYPQSIAECSLGRGPTPAGWGTIAIVKALVAVDRRLSFFGLIVLARGPMAIDTAHELNPPQCWFAFGGKADSANA